MLKRLVVSVLFFVTISFLSNISANPQSVIANQLEFQNVEKIKSLYKEKISTTPSFFLVPLQKALYDSKADFNDLYLLFQSPVELGSTITQYFKNPSMTNNQIIQSIYKELSPINQTKILQVNSNELVIFFKYIATRYKIYCKKQVPDIVFRPESGLVFSYNDIPYVFLSNFTSKHGDGTRVAEVPYNREWFVSQGYRVIDIPSHLAFEGSAEVKYVKHGSSVDLICGWGYRTNFETIDWVTNHLKEILKDDFSKITILPTHIIHDEYYHLDTALKEIPVIENGEIVDETIMYYPYAFDEKTQQKLKQKFPNAIVLSKHDAENFACNSPTINKSIIIDERVSKELQNTLSQRGIKVLSINLSEFFKAGGGGKCLICELDSDLFNFDPQYSHKIQMIESTLNIFDTIYVNDPYMTIGCINKGLAERQHKNLISLLQKEGAEVQFMDTSKFAEKFDFESLRKSVYEVWKKQELQSEELDELMIDAMQYFTNESNFSNLKYSQFLPELIQDYEKYFNSNSTYSWAILSEVLHDMKKEQYQNGENELVIDEMIIENPEDLLDFMNN